MSPCRSPSPRRRNRRPSSRGASATPSSTPRPTASRSSGSSAREARANRSTARSRSAGRTNEDDAAKTVREIWPNAGLGGELTYELPLPRHFEQATENVTPQQLKEELTIGPGAERYIAKIEEMVEAGYTHVYLHQIGPDEDGFFRFWEGELAPRLRR